MAMTFASLIGGSGPNNTESKKHRADQIPRLLWLLLLLLAACTSCNADADADADAATLPAVKRPSPDKGSDIANVRTDAVEQKRPRRRRRVREVDRKVSRSEHFRDSSKGKSHNDDESELKDYDGAGPRQYNYAGGAGADQAQIDEQKKVAKLQFYMHPPQQQAQPAKDDASPSAAEKQQATQKVAKLQFFPTESSALAGQNRGDGPKKEPKKVAKLKFYPQLESNPIQQQYDDANKKPPSPRTTTKTNEGDVIAHLTFYRLDIDTGDTSSGLAETDLPATEGGGGHMNAHAEHSAKPQHQEQQQAAITITMAPTLVTTTLPVRVVPTASPTTPKPPTAAPVAEPTTGPTFTTIITESPSAYQTLEVRNKMGSIPPLDAAGSDGVEIEDNGAKPMETLKISDVPSISPTASSATGNYDYGYDYDYDASTSYSYSYDYYSHSYSLSMRHATTRADDGYKNDIDNRYGNRHGQVDDKDFSTSYSHRRLAMKLRRRNLRRTRDMRYGGAE